MRCNFKSMLQEQEEVNAKESGTKHCLTLFLYVKGFGHSPQVLDCGGHIKMKRDPSTLMRCKPKCMFQEHGQDNVE